MFAKSHFKLELTQESMVHSVSGLLKVHSVTGLLMVHSVSGLLIVHSVTGLLKVHSVTGLLIGGEGSALSGVVVYVVQTVLSCCRVYL